MIEGKKKETAVPLRNLCLKTVLDELLSSHTDAKSPDLSVQWIPIELSQEVFDYCLGQTVAEEVNQVFQLFLKSPSKTPLQRLQLQNSRRADPELILELVKANLQTLTHVDVRGCRTLPKKFWSLVNQAPNLISLKTTKLLMPLKCPCLEVLVVDWKPKRVVQRFQSKLQNLYFDKLLENVLPNLRCLDLSWCPWVKRLQCLKLAKKLEILILRSCDVTCVIDDITQLTQLRALDISTGLETEVNQDFTGEYQNPEQMLEKITTSLERLESLDISGTNLAKVCSTDGSSIGSISALTSRDKRPFKFLGVYSTYNDTFPLEKLPATYIAANSNEKSIMAAIKRNSDMPKTMHSQLFTLKGLGGNCIDANEVLAILLKMLKNIRLTEYFRYWALKCTNSFLDYFDNPHEVVSEELRRELFLTLNRIIHSHMELDKIPEPVLCYTFKIFLKLLPPGKRCSFDEGTRREVMRLGKFLMSQNSMAFVYLKTEALLFRLLYQISLEPEVCVYLSENKAVPNCFDFFKTLQIYLGFALSIRQTTEIVPLVWKSILNFLEASPVANQDFIRNCGLSWMYSHTSWFTNDHQAQRDLYDIFMGIINQLEKYAAENRGTCVDIKHQNNMSECAKELMQKMKAVIVENNAEI